MLQKSIFDELDHERKLSYPDAIGGMLSSFYNLNFKLEENNIVQFVESLSSNLNRKSE
jgi:hypothetical protein